MVDHTVTKHQCPPLLEMRDRGDSPGAHSYGAAIYELWVLDGVALALSEENYADTGDAEELAKTPVCAEYITTIRFCPFCGVTLGKSSDNAREGNAGDAV